MSELKLLPCPFCGGEAELKRDAGNEVWPQSWMGKCTKSECGFSYGREFGSSTWRIEKEKDDAAQVAAVSKWNTRSPPTLPPVCPEDLVEGEWYAWKSAGNIHVGQVYSCGTDSTYIRCGATGIPVMDWNLYYGPLKFKIGGAE